MILETEIATDRAKAYWLARLDLDGVLKAADREMRERGYVTKPVAGLLERASIAIVREAHRA